MEEMVVKIYGFNLTVFMTCTEVNIPYEYVTINTIEGEHKSDKWVAEMHPFGQVPVLVKCRRLTWTPTRMKTGSSCTSNEQSPDTLSASTLQMLTIISGGRDAIPHLRASGRNSDSFFVPSTDDVQKYGLFEQAMSVEAFDFSQSISAIYSELGNKTFVGETPDEAILADHVRNFEAKLDVYEKLLKNQTYIAGDELTLADIAHAHLGCGLGLDFKMDLLSNAMKRPNVARWFGELITRPSYLELQESWMEYIKPFLSTMHDNL